MFALDTNALIHALKGQGRVRQRLLQEHPNDLVIPAVVAYELERGTLRSPNAEQRRRELRNVFGILTVLPFDQNAAEHAARLRIHLETIGAIIGPLDTLIAGTVLAHGAVLVTHNTAEFTRVPGLLMEDWF